MALLGFIREKLASMKTTARLGLLWASVAMLAVPVVVQAQFTTNTLTKSPLILKGLYANRSASAGRTSWVTRASAVVQGLRWLRDAQNKDGSWGGGADEPDEATGLALLAFLGHGETTGSQDFGPTVTRGMEFLIADMQATNRLVRKCQPPAFGHAFSTLAFCEEYSVLHNPALKSVAEDALAVILKGQRSSGLWNGFYRTSEGLDDIDVSVWQLCAVKSGQKMGSQMNGLVECLHKASAAMENILGAKPDAGTAAGAVLCLQLCGQGMTPVCRTALNELATMTPDWEHPSFKDPLFRWFLVNQALFNEGGEHWSRWQRLFYPMLVKHQVVQQDAQGKDIGYWDSPEGGERFGRVCSTALSVMMQEVFYQVNRFP